jgi:ribosomal-protein-alanine N-acetyltransferase
LDKVSKVPLLTENLVLRDFTAQDLPAYRALRSDAKFQRFSSEEESTDAKAAELLQLFIAQARAKPRLKYQLAITLKDGTLIGSCGARVEREGAASFGIEMGRPWHGSGFAREAAAALLHFAFETLPVHEVYAETIPENLAAVRLCRLLGFRQVEERIAARTFKGRSWTTAIYAIRRHHGPSTNRLFTSTADKRP